MPPRRARCDVTGVVMRGEHDRAKVGGGGANAAQHVQAVRFAGQWVELHRQKDRPPLFNHPNGLATRARLADDADSDSIEHELDGVEPDRMGVEENRVQGR